MQGVWLIQVSKACVVAVPTSPATSIHHPEDPWRDGVCSPGPVRHSSCSGGWLLRASINYPWVHGKSGAVKNEIWWPRKQGDTFV